jgi:nanoRNase/pAp phosphatase (c-di-AMP/oligoRNAs hydrolase)
MNHFLLYHRHAAGDCAASFAAFKCFASDLRGTSAMSTCAHNAHEVWWFVEAADVAAALAMLPGFVATRTVAVRVSPVVVP